MNISIKSWESACGLQAAFPVADMHLDLPGELLFRHALGETQVIRKHYLPVWKRAGICLVGAAVYVETANLPEGGLRNVLLQIAALRQELAQTKGQVHLVKDAAGLALAREKKSIGIFLYLEGLDFLGRDGGLLELLAELGVLGASLTWSRQNLLACGCCRAEESRALSGGITQEGRCVLEQMKKLGMFLDVSHLNDAGMEEVLKTAQLPVLATHANARAVYFHYRNLTEEQAAALAERDGLAGLNGCSLLTGAARDGRYLEWLVRHTLWMLEHMGEEHLCLGLDFCRGYELARRELGAENTAGADSLSGYEELALLIAALLEAGMTCRQLERMLGENAFAFLERVLAGRTLSGI